MNIHFSHERLEHAKECSCNPQRISPNICFNINFQRESIYTDQGDLKIGESGRLFESFIANKILIKTMKEVRKFGNLIINILLVILKRLLKRLLKGLKKQKIILMQNMK